MVFLVNFEGVHDQIPRPSTPAQFSRFRAKRGHLNGQILALSVLYVPCRSLDPKPTTRILRRRRLREHGVESDFVAPLLGHGFPLLLKSRELPLSL